MLLLYCNSEWSLGNDQCEHFIIRGFFAALVAWKTTRGLVHERCIADRWRQSLQIFEGVWGGRRSLRWNSAMASRCFGRSEKILFQSVSGLQGAELQQCKKNGRCIEQISGGTSESSEAWRASAFDHLHNFKKLFEESANRGTIHFPKVISRSLSKYLWNKFSFQHSRLMWMKVSSFLLGTTWSQAKWY